MIVDDIAKIMNQILSALGYVHQHGGVHRDVKPDNFMFADDSYSLLKLVDMGSAAQVGTERMSEVVGSVGYCAPEVFEGHCSVASDIFSAGVIMSMALTGKFPAFLRPEMWEKSDNKDAIPLYQECVQGFNQSEITKWATRLELPDPCLESSLSSMLDPEPAGRPSADEVRWSTWITQVDLKRPITSPLFSASPFAWLTQYATCVDRPKVG